ncbi:hypothetical protein FISHEDRAFT_70191 [Fistulina hepatica ATCC 64428]|uniref:Uncharacterized protein n=1 Tax=Fistulina hepatica ATCC 64428 TaxID=1128425 RepID=A0A0D7AJB7_9AGAR|nr:hypothetical protein FISHEDRAFT_70191 [Fistulina hepatica ATCC 64428]
MPTLKPLVLAVKGLLSHHGLNDASKGGLGSYGVIWMCVSLLQRKPAGRPDSYFTQDFISVSSGQILKKSQAALKKMTWVVPPQKRVPSMIIATFESAYHSLTEAAAITDESLLAPLLGVSEKAMAHRAPLRQVVIEQDPDSSQISSRSRTTKSQQSA